MLRAVPPWKAARLAFVCALEMTRSPGSVGTSLRARLSGEPTMSPGLPFCRRRAERKNAGARLRRDFCRAGAHRSAANNGFPTRLRRYPNPLIPRGLAGAARGHRTIVIGVSGRPRQPSECLKSLALCLKLSRSVSCKLSRNVGTFVGTFLTEPDRDAHPRQEETHNYEAGR